MIHILLLLQTDISHQKEVEADHVKVVEQRAHDAEENKRQTELFLDMVRTPRRRFDGISCLPAHHRSRRTSCGTPSVVS